MGNCLKRSSSDNISLLRGNENPTEGHTDPPPPYSSQLSENNLIQRMKRWETQDKARYLVEQSIRAEACEEEAAGPVYYPSPNISRTVHQLTEEEQIKIAKRMGLIQHLPTGVYDGCKKNRECVICMVEFVVGDNVRYLPCMHIYHVDCIDDWLMRSFTCPSCMEPVDAALLTSYETS